MAHEPLDDLRRDLYRAALVAGDFSATERVLDGLETLAGVGQAVEAEVARDVLAPVVSDLVAVLRDELHDQGELLRAANRIRRFGDLSYRDGN